MCTFVVDIILRMTKYFVTLSIFCSHTLLQFKCHTGFRLPKKKWFTYKNQIYTCKLHATVVWIAVILYFYAKLMTIERSFHWFFLSEHTAWAESIGFDSRQPILKNVWNAAILKLVRNSLDHLCDSFYLFVHGLVPIYMLELVAVCDESKTSCSYQGPRNPCLFNH